MDTVKQYSKRIQSLPDAIYVCDASGYINLFNKAAVTLWGREPEPGVERFCGSFKILNEDGSYMQPEKYPVAVAIKENRPVENVTISIKRPDGTILNVLQTSTLIYDETGLLAGSVNMQVEIKNNSIPKS